MRYLPGTRKVLFTAPHAVRQLRPGYTGSKPKPKDLFTGEIVAALATVTGSQALISTGKLVKDPNWHPPTPFHRRIEELVNDNQVKLVIDLHGASDFQSHEVIVRGNKYAKDVADLFVRTLGVHDFDAAVDNFKDDEQLTISEWLETKAIPAIELELTKITREHRRNELVDCLGKLVSRIKLD